jgi:hypothetical protein
MPLFADASSNTAASCGLTLREHCREMHALIVLHSQSHHYATHTSMHTNTLRMHMQASVLRLMPSRVADAERYYNMSIAIAEQLRGTLPHVAANRDERDALTVALGARYLNMISLRCTL